MKVISQHFLKCSDEFFDPTWNGLKNAEIRYKGDRNFKVDDILVLVELYAGEPTGRRICTTVLYILDDANYLPPDYVMLCHKPFKFLTAGMPL